jgi:hypothetical protein
MSDFKMCWGKRPFLLSLSVVLMFLPAAFTCKVLEVFPDQGCTVIYASDGGMALGGNNEDYVNPLTKVWFIPAEPGRHGGVYFGFDNYVAQGGMNDQGLFFDALGLDEVIEVSIEGKERWDGNLVSKVMSECGSIDEAVEIFENYYNTETRSWQYFFGDASGGSVIIEPNEVIRGSDGFQVATNFRQSVTPEGEVDCWRYQTALNMYSNMDTVSVEGMRDMLEAVHVESGSQTLYSNVYDLQTREVYVYHFHDYENVVVFNLEEELVKGYNAYDLSTLFSVNTAADEYASDALRDYRRLIDDRLDPRIGSEILTAYVGEYGMPDDWSSSSEALIVATGGGSLFLQFPDYNQYEVFPGSDTRFFNVGFTGGRYEYVFDVRFELSESRQVQSLILEMDSVDSVFSRIGDSTVVPEVYDSSPSTPNEEDPSTNATEPVLEPVPEPEPEPEPGPEPEPEPQPEDEPEPQPEDEPEPPPEDEPEKSSGIPGFSIGSVLIGVLICTYALWLKSGRM